MLEQLEDCHNQKHRDYCSPGWVHVTAGQEPDRRITANRDNKVAATGLALQDIEQLRDMRLSSVAGTWQ